MITRLLTILFASAAMVHPVAAQDSPMAPAAAQSLFQKFDGTWTAVGSSFGKNTRSTMTWSETLNRKFYRVDYSISMPEITPNRFIGIGHYRISKSARIEGYWADNSGDLHPLKASREPDRLVTIWGKAGSKMGRTEYRLLADDQMQVTDWLLTDKGWREFNNTLFRREKAPQ